ncbi:MAG: DEAD/DEAH box helicase [Allorhizobium sp.]
MKPFETLSEIRRQSVNALLAQLGSNNEALNNQLRMMLGADRADEGSILQEPVVEGAHPFVSGEETMAMVPPEVLRPQFVSLLDELDIENEYRFPKSRKPFRHQLQSWTKLAQPGKPQSVLVTSGTGSGKTECFLFPILSDLVRQTEGNSATLEGVQAILLYPLNALIESQKARLSAWTSPFKGRIRYCLYNGNLPQGEQPESDRKASPEVQIDRQQLRSSPAPILVTNITMLEYMLARAEDQPIIEKSSGKLRWIVLDEAHSLVGAAAAEVALLIRRVLLAFNTSPENVHFVATSATIGDEKDTDTDDKLRQFLAEVAGIPDDQVHLIKGERALPHRPPLVADTQAISIDATPSETYDQLGGRSEVWKFVEALKDKPQSLAALSKTAASVGLDRERFLALLAHAEKPNPDTGEPERLAPMRVHSFERAILGIWGCINPECADAPEGWPFGRLYHDRYDHCTSCGGPVVELITCTECGEPMLELEEDRTEGRVRRSRRGIERDEFQYEADRDGEVLSEEEADDEDTEAEAPLLQKPKAKKETILFAARPSAQARPISISKKDWKVLSGPTADSLNFRYEEKPEQGGTCPCCGVNALRGIDNLLRPVRFGAPFMVTSAAPILLNAVDARPNNERTLPASGKGLISFTDSRQGTARMSAKFQAESERGFLRSFIYHSVQDALGRTDESPEIAAHRKHLAEMESLVATIPALQPLINSKREEITKLTDARLVGVAWSDLVERLARWPEVEVWLRQVWEPRDPELFSDGKRIAEFLILRELLRRPRRANSLETLGLACLKFSAVEQTASMPAAFTRRGKTLADWKSFLTAVVNHFIRAKSAVDVGRDTVRWIAPQIRTKFLLGPGRTSGGDNRYVSWPKAPRNLSSLSMPQALLIRGLGLNLADPGDRDDIEDCLQMAWHQLQPILTSDREHPALDFTKAIIAPVTSAFICPITRRAVEIAPFGLSPYAKPTTSVAEAVQVPMPKLPFPILGVQDISKARDEIAQWLVSDDRVAAARKSGAWINISDRLSLFVDYARSAEHSAQQDGAVLRGYEKDFKEGRINILNCSTTMEMGVDIGSVSTVMMTNVPPSIANYRQRVGRAGRRRQPFSMAFTFCRDRPVDREAFRNPLGYLDRTMSAPKVAMHSRPIVQRHVNAFLLRQYMLTRGGDALKLSIGALMGCPVKLSEPRVENSPVAQFMQWLDEPTTITSTAADIRKLVSRSVLEHENALVADCLSAIRHIEGLFVNEWEGLRQLARDESESMKEAGRTRMSLELQRLCGEFLLSALADRGFLPGHGFPTNVVTFIPHRPKTIKQTRDEDPFEKKEPDGRRYTRLSGPQRSLDLAIRDYAPGSEVVLDGLVHRSAGVLLNWKRPATEEKVREVQSIRRHWCCSSCGAAETTREDVRACTECGAPVISREFLKPSGFAVDIRQQEHADTDRVKYVPPEDPVVSISSEPWVSLPIPSLGRYRGSSEGSVYYCNSGPTRNGYAVCLHCGRAEPEVSQTEDGNGTPAPSPLDGHKPLRRKLSGEKLVCEGLENRWKIKRNLALGYEITTDVFEFQPSARIERPAATALVIAMRGALAKWLGVEADEMGYSVHRSKHELGGDCFSLMVFDKNAGGAGFSVSMGDNIARVLNDAERILDCKNPGCIEGCASCVLTSDAPFEDGELDRVAALSFVRAELNFGAVIDPQDRFSEDTKLSVSITDEIDRELKRRNAPLLRIYLPESADLASIPTWSIMQELATWTHRGYSVAIVLPENLIGQADQASKMMLQSLGYRLSGDNSDFPIHIGRAPALPNSAGVLATVSSDGFATTWASHSASSRNPDASWGQAVSASIFRGTVPDNLSSFPVAPEELSPKAGAKVVLIKTELDLKMTAFGDAMAKLIRTSLTQIGFATSESLVRVDYKDPYVRSPLAGRLLIDTAAALMKGAGSSKLNIRTAPPKTATFSGKYLWHDWPDKTVLSSVLGEYGRVRNVDVDVQVGDCGHGRFMELQFTDGRIATVIFDQGFGAWSPTVRDHRAHHGFSQSAAKQALAMQAFDLMLVRKGIWPTYVVVKAL